MIESGVTIDYGTLVMDNDIARICKYVAAWHPHERRDADG